MTVTTPLDTSNQLLADLIVRLLEDPAVVDAELIRFCFQNSGGGGPSPEVDHLRLTLILAALYARPQFIGRDAVVTVTSVLSRSPLADDTADLASQVLGHLAYFRVPTAAASLLALLRHPELSAATYSSLVNALADATPWMLGDLDLAALIDLAAQPHLSEWRDTLLKLVVERRLFYAPQDLTRRNLDRLVETFADSSDLTSILSYLRGRSQLDPDVAGMLAERKTGPLGEKVRAYLGTGRRRALIVQNIADHQGDDLVRVVPLAQSLLDLNPDLEITLVTARAYLYSHPRITLIPIEDRAATHAALRQQFEVVLEYFEQTVITCNYDVPLRAAIAAYLQKYEPFIDLGADKGHGHFVYGKVNVEGRSCVDSLELDRLRLPNVYETTFRLIAGLGLPLRLGEEQPVSEPVIAGIFSQEADAAWRDLTHGNVDGRPVALMNPFGGGNALKGYVEQTFGELVDRIRETISEGFFIVLLPNGTPWGGRGLALKVVSMLGPEERRMVSVGADPATQPGPVTLHSPHPITVPGPGHAMHLVTHFIRFSDCLIAVDGWMIHAAYLLGKPFRTLALPYSELTQWLPYGRTANQALVRPAAVPNQLESGHPVPPLPSQPRKFVLLTLLRGLATVPHPRVLAVLRWAVSSQDRHVRRVAACALRQQPDPSVSADLYRLLDDSFNAVRSEAAAGLLERMDDNRTGAPLSRDELLAHRWIGEEPRRWDTVIGLGDAARPALSRSLHDDDDVVRREAGQVLYYLERRSNPPVKPRKLPFHRRLQVLFRRRT